MKDSAFIQQMLQRGMQAQNKLTSEFTTLSAEQLNWKPSENVWSMAQCLDHLIISNTSYFSVFEAITNGTFSMNLWEKMSPFNRINTMLLKGTMQEEVKIKLTTHPKFASTVSDVPSEISTTYRLNLEKFLSFIEKSREIDIDKTVITSPAISIVTYSLRDVFWLLTEHQHRHLNQAIRVKANSSFPSK